MRAQQLSSPQLRRLAELINSIGACMLTREVHGVLQSRPMLPLELDNAGCFWFLTRVGADGVGADTGQRHAVNLAFSQPDDAAYVSVAGDATLSQDRRKAQGLWSPMATLWFPQGIDDPSLALLQVRVNRADYWDAQAGRMTRLFPGAAPAG